MVFRCANNIYKIAMSGICFKIIPDQDVGGRWGRGGEKIIIQGLEVVIK